MEKSTDMRRGFFIHFGNWDDETKRSCFVTQHKKSDPFYRTLRIESHRHPVSAKADSKPVGCGTQPTPLNAARFPA